tara:strand:+ start:12864 stop:13115 length:252 start_codon:yes stop_codon:yes gene_type:complete
MKTKRTVALVTFGLFMTEAILHYNMGVKKTLQDEEKKGRSIGINKYKFQIPPTAQLVELAVVVGIFSLANGFLIDMIQKRKTK